MVDIKKLALAYFYGTIRDYVKQFIGGLFGMPIDLVMILIGWWKQNTWWGETLIISGATALGLSQPLALPFLGGAQHTATTTSQAEAKTSYVAPPQAQAKALAVQLGALY